MKLQKAIHDLFLFEDDLFRNEACTGMKRNRYRPWTNLDPFELIGGLANYSSIGLESLAWKSTSFVKAK